jgi:lipopolysaccharide/colanic/teichoic acid biosynthesis glycosyltransferase
MLVSRASTLVETDALSSSRLGRSGWETELVHLAGALNASEVYDEHVVRVGPEHGVRVRRVYHAHGSSVERCVLTGDEELARRWSGAAAGTPLDEWARGAGIGTPTRSIPARLADAEDAEDARGWLMEVAQDPRGLEAAFPHARRIADRAWAHDGVALPTRAKFVGPIFVGAGATLPDDAVLVGPLLMPDRAGITPEDVDQVVVRRERSSRYWWPVHSDRPKSYRWSKRLFDIVVSAAALVVLSPVFAAVALLILIEDGRPVFFRHRRQTIFGREFDCLKFRSMVRNADAMQAKLRQSQQNAVDGPQFHMDNDPRILRIGHVLRATQLDELPQLINVLRGDMSLVGPRPSPDRENQYCPSWREARLSVRAGITGLWQVCRQRGQHTDFQEWIRYDIEYVQHRSWGLDLWILWKTVARFLPRAIRGDQAPRPPYWRS